MRFNINKTTCFTRIRLLISRKLPSASPKWVWVKMKPPWDQFWSMAPLARASHLGYLFLNHSQLPRFLAPPWHRAGPEPGAPGTGAPSGDVGRCTDFCGCSQCRKDSRSGSSVNCAFWILDHTKGWQAPFPTIADMGESEYAESNVDSHHRSSHNDAARPRGTTSPPRGPGSCAK